MKCYFRQTLTTLGATAALAALATTAQATTFTFDTDPFEGSDAPTTAGRQVVGGEVQINFDIANDVFALHRGVFGVQSLSFANGEIGSIPSSGVNVVVLRTFDNDNDPNTPFGAGNAANLIANQITSPGPGFFVYFNQGLDLPRLVFSPNLDDNTSDLKILARMLNLTGQAGRDAMANFTAANFQAVPDPASALTLVLCAGSLLGAGYTFRRKG